MAKRNIYFMLSVSCLIAQFSFSQPPVTIEMGSIINAAGQQMSDGLMIYGAESLKKNVTYADVKGSPYLNDSFRISILYDHNDKAIARVKSRINLYSHMLHFLDIDGKELVVGPELVKKIQYVDPYDEKKIWQEFSSGVYALNLKLEKPVYVQLMNSGGISLLKYKHKYITTYDSLMGQTKRYMFAAREDYYLVRQASVEPLRKLNKERLLAYTRYERELTEFATQNKLDFRKEEDVVAILNHLNAINKKQE